ncbi:MAG: hypothetical protein WC548_01090 [Candidatus Pacearchaeota archaeon]
MTVKQRLEWAKVSKHIAIGVDIAFAVLLLVNYFIRELPKFWNLTYIFFFVVVMNVIYLSLKIKNIPEEKRKNSKMLYYFSHLFLLSLVIIALNQFLKRPFVNDFLPEITMISIALGFLTFYANRNKVEQEIESDKIKEENAEKRRAEEFDWKFRKLAWFDFDYGIKRAWSDKRYGLWLLRVLISPVVWIARLPYSFVRWMYKEGWWYSVGLIAIVALGFVLRVWNLGKLSPVFDEYLHLNAGKRFFLEGSFNYPRARFLSYLIGIIFTLNGGTSVFLARLPLVIISSSSVFFIYFLGREINKKTGLITSYLFAFCPMIIGMSRYIREYEFYLFLFIILLLFIIKISKNILKNRRYLKNYIIFIILIMGYYFFIERIIVIIEILIISLIFLFVYNYKALSKKISIKHIILIGAILVILILFFLNAYSEVIDISFKGEKLYSEMLFDGTWNYKGFTLNWFSGTFVGKIFLISVFLCPLLFNRRKLILSSYISFLIFFIGLSYIANTYFAPRYIYYAYPFYILIFSFSIYLILKTIKSSKYKKIYYLISLLIVFAFFGPLNSIEGISSESNGIVDIKTGMVHYDIHPLFNFLTLNNFSNKDVLISSDELIFSYYYNYTYLKDFENYPLKRIDYHKESSIPEYDYSDIFVYYYTEDIRYNYFCRDSVCNMSESDRIYKIMSKYKSGWLILDKDRNKNWNDEGFPQSSFNLEDIPVTYIGSTEGYRGFDIYRWSI